MPHKRKKMMVINTAEQLSALKSPKSMEIVIALRQFGEATVSELGSMLGLRANSLHYHILKLKSAGLIRQTNSKRSGARTEAAYDVVADRFESKSTLADPVLRKLTVETGVALLRLAIRNFTEATNEPKNLSEHGKHRNIWMSRLSARLTSAQLAEVNKHLDAIQDLFCENIGSQKGKPYTLTSLLTPDTRDCH